ncbi:MAG TPA: hypothetical protein VFU38_01005, partial [Candidatus Krumholzibacteria bacterium]|nr:hypothetical protein [Candidatus Krumholzibacteria bacterium]
MKGTKKGIVLAPVFAVFANAAFAEPSYLIYPNTPVVFRYDPARYETVTAGDPKFDPTYSVGTLMLWDRIDGRVPVEIYRAPIITSFEESTSGQSEFVTVGDAFEIIVDGFGPEPRTIGGLCVRFTPEPAHALVQLLADGQLCTGLTHFLPTLEVVTPSGGGYYSDTSRFLFSWAGASQLRIVAFSDKDADGAFDGTPLYSIIARDETVPVSESTWGQIKAMYRR